MIESGKLVRVYGSRLSLKGAVAELHLIKIAAAIVISAPLLSAQSSRPQFEVVSIKRQLPPIRRATFRLEGGRFFTEGLPAKYLLMRAFGVSKTDVLGAPDWLDSDYYSVEAKVDDTIPPDELPRMLQDLLADRF